MGACASKKTAIEEAVDHISAPVEPASELKDTIEPEDYVEPQPEKPDEDMVTPDPFTKQDTVTQPIIKRRTTAKPILVKLTTRINSMNEAFTKSLQFVQDVIDRGEPWVDSEFPPEMSSLANENDEAD